MVRAIVDRPLVVTITLAVAVALQALGTQFEVVPNPWAELLASDVGTVQVPVYLGLASVGAVTAGFAGVVVVFVLQASSPAFRKLRVDAHNSIRSNSISIIASSIGAALAGLVGSFLAGTGHAWTAAWALELGALVLVHAVVRALALFKAMIGVVVSDDEKAAEAARQREISNDLTRRRGAKHAG